MTCPFSARSRCVGDREIPLPRTAAGARPCSPFEGEVVPADVLIEEPGAGALGDRARARTTTSRSCARSSAATRSRRESPACPHVDPQGSTCFASSGRGARQTAGEERVADRRARTLARWPLADLAYDEIGIREAGRLNSCALAARMTHDAELERGRSGTSCLNSRRSSSSIASARPARAVMLAPHRSGRQADALTLIAMRGDARGGAGSSRASSCGSCIRRSSVRIPSSISRRAAPVGSGGRRSPFSASLPGRGRARPRAAAAADVRALAEAVCHRAARWLSGDRAGDEPRCLRRRRRARGRRARRSPRGGGDPRASRAARRRRHRGARRSRLRQREVGTREEPSETRRSARRCSARHRSWWRRCCRAWSGAVGLRSRGISARSRTRQAAAGRAAGAAAAYDEAGGEKPLPAGHGRRRGGHRQDAPGARARRAHRRRRPCSPAAASPTARAPPGCRSPRCSSGRASAWTSRRAASPGVFCETAAF